MGRAPCCDKANVKKGPWSPEEDAKLKDFIHKFGTAGNWIALPQKAGLKRCGKSCRLRWLNYLRPNIKHGEFSDEEDSIICALFSTIGSRWSIIAAQLPGRTDNDIKNYWNTKLKKKLMGLNTITNNNNAFAAQLSEYPLSSLSHNYYNQVFFQPCKLLSVDQSNFSLSTAQYSFSSSFYDGVQQNQLEEGKMLDFQYNNKTVSSYASSSDGSCSHVLKQEDPLMVYDSQGFLSENYEKLLFGDELLIKEEEEQLVSSNSCNSLYYY